MKRSGLRTVKTVIFRLNKLKRKFKVDKNYHQDHVKFVQDIMTQGYVKIVPDSWHDKMD